MKAWIALLLFLTALLLLSTGTSAMSGPRYQVEPTTLSGGSYQIGSFGVQAGNLATGGEYRLLGPSAPELRGSGCCCTYVPCTLRNR